MPQHNAVTNTKKLLDPLKDRTVPKLYSTTLKILSKCGLAISIALGEIIFTPPCLEMDMPRASKVPQEDRINVIKECMEYFVTNTFPPYTSPIWIQMSKKLEGRWTPHDVYLYEYTNVRENRSKILSTARDELGIVVLDVKSEVPQPQRIDTTAINDKISSDSDDGTWSADENAKRRKINNQEIETTEFELVPTEEEWNSMKPDGTVLYDNRNTEIL